MVVFYVIQIVQIAPNRAKHLIYVKRFYRLSVRKKARKFRGEFKKEINSNPSGYPQKCNKETLKMTWKKNFRGFLLCSSWGWIGMTRYLAKWTQNITWTYIRRSDVHECLLNVICTFNLRPVCSGWRMEILVCFELSTNNRKFGRRIKVFIDLRSWLVLTSVPIEREEDAGRMGANG